MIHPPPHEITIIGNGAPDMWTYVFPDAVMDEFRRVAHVVSTPGFPERTGGLKEKERSSTPAASVPPDLRDRIPAADRPVHVVLSTWGAEPLDRATLELLPDLRLVRHAAGSVKPFVTDALVERGVPVVSAAVVNARPVAEFVLGLILTSLKNVFAYQTASGTASLGGWNANRRAYPGGYHRTKVGLWGYGKITQLLLERLRPFDLDVYVADEYFGPKEEARFGARAVTPKWLVANCDVISLHHADVPKNRHLLNAETLARVPRHCRIINTARGRLVDHEALANLLAQRADVTAYLDVTWPEPLPPDDPLWSQPNCFLTPHIAGSVGTEVHRMSWFCLRQLTAWLNGTDARALDGVVPLSALGDLA